MTHNKILRFEDMTVWQDSQTLAVNIYSLTRRFPDDEKYGLTSQVRRCSSSVSANIAEGFGRSTDKDKSYFYHIALGSLMVTKNFIYLARRLEFVEKKESETLLDEIESIHRQITAILGYFSKK